MKIGRLRHKVDIEQKINVPDGGGGRTETWAAFASGVYAAIEPASGKEYFDAQQLQTSVTHKIRIRYKVGVTAAMRVKFGTRIFSIVSPPIDFEERHRDMLLMCKEASPTQN